MAVNSFDSPHPASPATPPAASGFAGGMAPPLLQTRSVPLMAVLFGVVAAAAAFTTAAATNTATPLEPVVSRLPNIALLLMNGFRIFSIVAWASLISFVFAGPIIVWARYHSGQYASSPKLDPSKTPLVTILRPLKGIDTNIESNLESSFLQDYPNYEITFCVASETDPIIPIVHKLRRKYPHVACKLIVGDKKVGVNPKVNNLIRGYEAARSDIVWILDSNVRTSTSALSRAAEILQQPGVGLVHHVPCAVNWNSFGSLLDGVFLNTVHARMYSTINWFSVASCVIGKSNLFRRSDLEDIGGLAYFGRFMSEDNIVGVALMNKGYTHRIAPEVVYQVLGSATLEDYFGRRARWSRIRKYVVTAATLYEPFTESIFSSAFAGWALVYFFGISFWPFFLLSILTFFVSDVIVAAMIQPDGITGSGWNSLLMFAIGWIVREVTALPIYIWAVSDSHVKWRGQRYYLHTDGTVELLAANEQPTRPVGYMLPIFGPEIRKPKSVISRQSARNSKTSSAASALIDWMRSFWRPKEDAFFAMYSSSAAGSRLKECSNDSSPVHSQSQSESHRETRHQIRSSKRLGGSNGKTHSSDGYESSQTVDRPNDHLQQKSMQDHEQESSAPRSVPSLHSGKGNKHLPTMSNDQTDTDQTAYHQHINASRGHTKRTSPSPRRTTRSSSTLKASVTTPLT